MASETLYFVYLLSCEDGSLYTAITTDVVKRLREHLTGRGRQSRYVRSHKPVGLVALWAADDRAAASRLAYRIKHLTAREKRALVDDPASFVDLPGLAGRADEYRALDGELLSFLWNRAATVEG